MIGKGTAAALVFAGGALLGGCAQTPALYNQPPPVSYQPEPHYQPGLRYLDPAAASTAMRDYLEAQQRAYQQQNQPPPAHGPPPAARRAIETPVAEAPPSAVPAAPQPRAVPHPVDVRPSPVNPDCVGWWRICHFL